MGEKAASFPRRWCVASGAEYDVVIRTCMRARRSDAQTLLTERSACTRTREKSYPKRSSMPCRTDGLERHARPGQCAVYAGRAPAVIAVSLRGESLNAQRCGAADRRLDRPPPDRRCDRLRIPADRWLAPIASLRCRRFLRSHSGHSPAAEDARAPHPHFRCSRRLPAAFAPDGAATRAAVIALTAGGLPRRRLFPSAPPCTPP